MHGKPRPGYKRIPIFHHSERLPSPQWCARLKNEIERDSPLLGKHVVFGKVIRGYDEVIKKITEVPVDGKDRPKAPVTIENCGELELRKKQEDPPPGTYREAYMHIEFLPIPS